MDKSINRKLRDAHLAADECVIRLQYLSPRLNHLSTDEMKERCESYQAQRIRYIRDIGAATNPLRDARLALSGPPPTCCGLSAASAHELAFDVVDCIYALLAFQVNQKTIPLLGELYAAAEQGNEAAQQTVTDLEAKLPHLNRVAQEARTCNFSLLEAEIKRELQMAKETAKRNAAADESGADHPVIVPTNPSAEPVKKYLMNWGEILKALGLNDSASLRNRVRNANEKFTGPIRHSGQGSSPFVEKGKLLAWWNSIEERYENMKQREQDAKTTVDNQYKYGRSGEAVVPDIQGRVKRRRKDRKS